MESALTKACTIKIENFEGPFDLLFHLIEKNQMSIYDIPINEITDQYMDYLFAMRELDLEIASEFLVMASTLLHIKSRMLLPEKKEKQEEEADPREELVMRLIEYKKYKEFSSLLKIREQEWEKVFYKLPEVVQIRREDEIMELSADQLVSVYTKLLRRNEQKMNRNVENMERIVQYERVSLKSKMKEILRILFKKPFFKFSEFFPLRKKPKIEVVTGFLAVLELVKLKKILVSQEKPFSDIIIQGCSEDAGISRDDSAASEN